ncbi:MAG: TIGR04282 family arsenosugar biosynthesis glycosyltransferase [Myxococcaceae bacterium]
MSRAGRRRGTLCVFAKPPRPGASKTRLAPEVGIHGAAALAEAFLRDTWQLARDVPWARAVLATTGPTAAVEAEELWLQGRGDLGERMERVLRRALRQGGFAVAMGADSPGLPLRLLEEARGKLERFDAVLGPSADGGFYLLGLNLCPRGLLHGLPWSRSDTCARTLSRLRGRGLRTALLEPWFDVDRPGDLRRLSALVGGGWLHAPRTEGALRALGLLPQREAAR